MDSGLYRIISFVVFFTAENLLTLLWLCHFIGAFYLLPTQHQLAVIWLGLLNMPFQAWYVAQSGYTVVYLTMIWIDIYVCGDILLWFMCHLLSSKVLDGELGLAMTVFRELCLC